MRGCYFTVPRMASRKLELLNLFARERESLRERREKKKKKKKRET